MSGDQIDTSPLIEEPAPITALSDIDLEEGRDRQIQCPICRQIDAPCKCKGTSKYVHRKCLDQWHAKKQESEIDLEEGCDGQIQSPICRETDAHCKFKGKSKYDHCERLDRWHAEKRESEIDLEEGRARQIQCPICRGTDAPCKCKGTSKYVHRKRPDDWHAVKHESEIDLDEGGDRQIQSPKYRETDGGYFLAPSKFKGTYKYVHRERLDRWHAEKQESEIDLEEGRDRQIQCSICRETYGGYFIAPSKFKGTSKYVHPERLDRWRAEKQELEIDLEKGRDRQIQCPRCRETYAPSMFKGTSKYVHREHLDRGRAEKQETLISKLPRNNLTVKCSEKMNGDQIDTSPLIAPALITVQSEIDHEKGCDGEIQCRICFETRGDNFIAPCKCKGTSKYVHRKCLDQWRAEKEGYAFSQCETCKAPYYLKVHTRRWQKLKFGIFVARDILFVFIVIQLVIGLLAYLAYLIDDWQKFRLRLTWGFGSELSFYYICGAILFLALLGLSGCIITCFDRTLRNDPAQPCREFCHCCCNTGTRADYRADYQTPRTIIIWNEYNTAGSEGCCNESCDCSCSGAGDESGLALLVVVAIIGICLFAVIGIFYSVLVTTVIGQLIWRRHYHILEKTMLTKVYVVQDVDGKMDAANWSPPPLKPEHVEELKKLGLLPY